jgi:hypothetical protein
MRGRETQSGSAHRPDIVADFLYAEGCLFFSVRNIGSAPATSVVVRFRPAIRGAQGAFSRLRVFQGISFLAPGRELTLFIDSAGAYFHSREPTRVTTRVSWYDEGGVEFSRTSVHDLEIYRKFPEALHTRAPA